MPDETIGQTAGEQTSAPATGEFNEYTAAQALEGILDFGDEGDAGDTKSAPEADAGSEETQTTGDEEGQSEAGEEQSEAAPIEPPKSWSDDDKATFSKLPPEAQAVIARRESERDAAFTRRTQEIAEERKAFEAERQTIATQRQQYQESLQQLLHVAIPEAKAFADIDWQKLATESPAEYVRLSAQRDALRQRVGAVQAEMARVSQQTQTEQQQRLQAAIAEQKAKLVERIPEFGDPEKGKKLGSDLRTYLSDLGFQPNEIDATVDHRLVVLARDGMLYRQAEAARKAAEAKRVNPAPTVQRPGTARATGDGPQRQFQDRMNRLGRSGSTRDAALILESLL